jgi:hypothetical protein
MAKLLATTVTGVMNVSSTTNSANYVTTAGLDVLGVANSAQNTVAFHADGGLILAKSNLNFNNTATVTIAATANGTGQVNVAFTAIGGGSQGATGLQGIQGTTGAGTQGTTGAGTQGATGIQGLQGATGAGQKMINFIISGGGVLITTGAANTAQSKGVIEVGAQITIADWDIYANTGPANANIVVDVYTGTYSAYPDSVILISGTNPPRLDRQAKNTSASITGWSSGVIAAGNVIEFRVNSAVTPANTNQVTVSLGFT